MGVQNLIGDFKFLTVKRIGLLQHDEEAYYNLFGGGEYTGVGKFLQPVRVPEVS